MILVLAGTFDGRSIAKEIVSSGYEVCACVISDYGRELAQQDSINVICGAMDQIEMESFLVENNVCLIVDATHPYAVKVTKNAAAAARAKARDYVRYERPEQKLPKYDKLVQVDDMEAAVDACQKLGNTWFLTTGSRHVGLFAAAANRSAKRVVARVLPQPEVIADCLTAGLKPADIIAMQGPFSFRMNEAIFHEVGADVVVTKNSGEIGGTLEKIQAAMSLGLWIVAVNRPSIEHSCCFSDMTTLIEYIQRSYPK